MSSPRQVREILREMKLFPEKADLAAKPESRPQECAFCHQTFTSNPQWFGSSWKYPNVCADCGEYGPWARILHDREFWKDIEPAPERTFVCNGCNHEGSARPRFDHGVWRYDFKCLKCGEEAVGLFRLRTICEACGERMYMDDKLPVKRCRACLKKRRDKQTESGGELIGPF